MIKKSILYGLVVSTALPAPMLLQADPTLYGRLRLGVLVSDVENGDTTADIVNASSRFGIKGSEALGNGLEAVYRYEFGVNADEARISTEERQRKSYVGLKGDFGRLILGTEDSAVDVASGYIDPTEELGDNINPFSGRVDNLLQYNYSADAFEVIAGVKIDGDDRASDGIDAYYTALQIFNGGITAGIFYEHIGDLDALVEDSVVTQEAEDEVDRIGAGIAYEFGQFRLAALYAQEDNGSDDDYTGYGVSLDYSPTDNSFFSVVYQTSEDDDDTGADADFYILAAKHSLSERTLLFAEYLKTDFSSTQENDSDDLLVGISHDF